MVSHVEASAHSCRASAKRELRCDLKEETLPCRPLDRRAAARRRAWGRGPMILRFEPLEGRQLMAALPTGVALPDLVSTSFTTPQASDYNSTIEVKGAIANVGSAAVPPGAIAGIYASTHAGDRSRISPHRSGHDQRGARTRRNTGL